MKDKDYVHWEDWKRIKIYHVTTSEIRELCSLHHAKDAKECDFHRDIVGREIIRHPKDKAARSYKYRITSVRMEMDARKNDTASFVVETEKVQEEKTPTKKNDVERKCEADSLYLI